MNAQLDLTAAHQQGIPTRGLYKDHLVWNID